MAEHDLIAGETFIKTTGPWGLYLGPSTKKTLQPGDILVAYRGQVFKTFKKKITGTEPYLEM